MDKRLLFSQELLILATPPIVIMIVGLTLLIEQGTLVRCFSFPKPSQGTHFCSAWCLVPGAKFPPDPIAIGMRLDVTLFISLSGEQTC